MRAFAFLVAALVGLSSLVAAPATKLTPAINKMMACSYTIKVEGTLGSAVLIVRDHGQYVWTAHHVVQDKKEALITKPLLINGEDIGSVQFKVEVLCTSEEYDLALCRLLQTELTGTGADFYLGDTLPVGTPVYHVGSILGEDGSLSFTAGYISRLNRSIRPWKRPKDQYDLTGSFGSSGGGVFNSDGQCVGLMVGGVPAPLALIAPVRHMKVFAAENCVEWAIDPSK